MDARNQAFGGSAIIAVKSACAASLLADIGFAGEFADASLRFWTNSTSSRSSTPGSTGARNFAPSIAMK